MPSTDAIKTHAGIEGYDQSGGFHQPAQGSGVWHIVPVVAYGVQDGWSSLAGLGGQA